MFYCILHLEVQIRLRCNLKLTFGSRMDTNFIRHESSIFQRKCGGGKGMGVQTMLCVLFEFSL
jgi:hypothetical protein